MKHKITVSMTQDELLAEVQAHLSARNKKLFSVDTETTVELSPTTLFAGSVSAYEAMKNLLNEVRNSGNRIHMVQLVMKLTGLSLKDSKFLIDSFVPYTRS
jgi:ribosomal protein L7/L12